MIDISFKARSQCNLQGCDSQQSLLFSAVVFIYLGCEAALCVVTGFSKISTVTALDYRQWRNCEVLWQYKRFRAQSSTAHEMLSNQGQNRLVMQRRAQFHGQQGASSSAVRPVLQSISIWWQISSPGSKGGKPNFLLGGCHIQKLNHDFSFAFPYYGYLSLPFIRGGWGKSSLQRELWLWLSRECQPIRVTRPPSCRTQFYTQHIPLGTCRLVHFDFQ